VSRFDIYQLQGIGNPHVVDVQSDLLKHLNTVVTVPLIKKTRAIDIEMVQLKPKINFQDKEWIFVTTDMGAIPRTSIKKTVGNISNQQDDIIRAIDFLFSGF